MTIVPPKEIYAHPDSRIFLSVRKLGKHYQNEIAKQLADMGIREERIVRVDKIIDALEQKAYFDLTNLPHEKDETFVDAGAFDGASSRAFAEWARDFCHIYAFEPDPQNISACKETLKTISEERTTLLPYGVWRDRRELRFNGLGKVGSNVAEHGNICVPVTSIDEELAGKRITFIKMDIEGSEMEALQGAAKTIRMQHPKLAISIYHKPEDILELPHYILSLNPKYRMYLRHYALMKSETVLYCL